MEPDGADAPNSNEAKNRLIMILSERLVAAEEQLSSFAMSGGGNFEMAADAAHELRVL
jgi:hypothetical protein